MALTDRSQAIKITNVALGTSQTPKANSSTGSQENSNSETTKNDNKNPSPARTQSTSDFNSKVNNSINKFLRFNFSTATPKNSQNPYTPMMGNYGGASPSSSSPSSSPASSPSSSSPRSSSTSSSSPRSSSTSSSSPKTKTGSSNSGPSFGNQEVGQTARSIASRNPDSTSDSQRDSNWGKSSNSPATSNSPISGGVSIDNNGSNDPLYTGTTPKNFTIMAASGSRENAKANTETGEHFLNNIHRGIMSGQNLGDTLRSSDQQKLFNQRGEYLQTPQLYGAGRDQKTLDFSQSNPVQNGRGIILTGNQGEASVMSIDRQKTIDWMKAIGITDIQEVHNEKEFEAAIKKIKDDADSSGEKLDLLAYSVIAHGNNSEHLPHSSSNDKKDKSYISLDLQTRYEEEDLRGDMEYGASSAKQTVALIHSCNSGGIDTDSVSNPNPETKKEDTEEIDPTN